METRDKAACDNGNGERLAYRPQEVARILGLGTETTYRLIRSGEIPSFRSPGTGRAVLVRRSDLLRWLGEAPSESAPRACRD